MRRSDCRPLLRPLLGVGGPPQKKRLSIEGGHGEPPCSRCRGLEEVGREMRSELVRMGDRWDFSTQEHATRPGGADLQDSVDLCPVRIGSQDIINLVSEEPR